MSIDKYWSILWADLFAGILRIVSPKMRLLLCSLRSLSVSFLTILSDHCYSLFLIFLILVHYIQPVCQNQSWLTIYKDETNIAGPPPEGEQDRHCGERGNSHHGADNRCCGERWRHNVMNGTFLVVDQTSCCWRRFLGVASLHHSCGLAWLLRGKNCPVGFFWVVGSFVWVVTSSFVWVNVISSKL